MHESSSGPVGAYVEIQADVILKRRDDVAANGPDAVHATRVACRRLRSTLHTFRALWTVRHRAVSADLRWYGRFLGSPRDTEVLEEGLLDLMADLHEPGAADLVARLRRRLDGDRAAGLSALATAMRTDRFEQLTTRVHRLVADARWDPIAAVPAHRLLPALAYGPVYEAALLAGRLPETGPHRLEVLHELRKQGKAARYGYEAIGAPGAREAARWKDVTEELGHVQDGVVSSALLDELQQAARVAGEALPAYAALRAAVARQMRSGERRGLDALAVAVAEAP